MKQINLLNENGKKFSVYVVRYFRFKLNTYLIYTLQEKDDRDYMKLYVVKVMNELNEKVSQTVRRNDEWKLMKGIVKTILTQIKQHKLTCIEDLDSSELEEMIIYESKSFFIASDLVEILSTEPQDINSSTLLTNNSFEENIEEKELNSVQQITEEIPFDSDSEEIEILELDDELDNDSSSEEEIEVLEL